MTLETRFRTVEAPRAERRACSPQDTAARVLQHAGLLGVTRVANVTGLDCIGIPVVMVTRPNSRSISVAQGKGISLESARASGLMEALELHHAEQCLVPLRLGSWREMSRRFRVAVMEGLPLVATSRYHDDLPLLWCEGVNLLDRQRVLVPHELVHTNFTTPLPPGSGCFAMSSNGLASGNTPKEALIHALCELIERDATTLWYLRDEAYRAATRIDLATVRDPGCRSLLDRFACAGVQVAAWDATSDVGLPVFRCTVSDAPGERLLPIPEVEGMGCHLVREVALQRALTEAAQVRLTAIAGARDDNGRSTYLEAQRTLETAAVATPPGKDFGATPSYMEDSEDDDLARLLERLDCAGMPEIITVDLTDPHIKVPVVRVVVPRLETYHHVAGYVPGSRARSAMKASGASS